MSVNATDFMVRWHGSVQPLYPDTYAFSTATDDGARLWVNGQMLVNDWNGHAVTTNTVTVPLVAYQKYAVVMEYYQGTGADSAQLSWSSVHQAPQVIPMSQLYPDANAALTPPLSGVLSANGTNLKLNWPGTFNLQSATNVAGPWLYIVTNSVGPYTVTNVHNPPQRYFRLINQ